MISQRKMKDFDTFTKIAWECRRLGQINCCQRLWKVSQSPINHPIWSHWLPLNGIRLIIQHMGPLFKNQSPDHCKNKKKPNFSKAVQKRVPATVYTSKRCFSKKPQKSPTFDRKFVSRNYDKSPNLVTLVQANVSIHAYCVTPPTAKRKTNCFPILKISKGSYVPTVKMQLQCLFFVVIRGNDIKCMRRHKKKFKT